jgi:hypothetical protein
MGVLYPSYLTSVVATPMWGVDSGQPRSDISRGAHSAVATVPTFVTWIPGDLILQKKQ